MRLKDPLIIFLAGMMVSLCWSSLSQAEECVTIEEYREFVIGERRTVNRLEGGTVTCETVGYHEVPGMTMEAYHTVCDNGVEGWSHIVGDTRLLYRECGTSGCVNYDPPWVAMRFPLCPGDEWQPEPVKYPSWKAKVVASGLTVSVPAGTFQNCARMDLFVGTTLYGTGFHCPCVRSVKDTNYVLGDSFELESYDVCPDLDGDGYWDSDCVPSIACGGDCNDLDPNVHPGEQEICNDLIDNNCNGLIDCADPACEGTPECTWGPASTMGQHPSSDISRSQQANVLLLSLFLPVAGYLVMRYIRRRRG